MNPAEPSPTGDEEFARWLADYDEALAAGTAAAFAPPIPDEWRTRLRRAQGCLHLLAALWPEPAAPVAAPTEEPPRTDAGRIGRFVLERELGRGGFGIVYLAHDPALKRPVALKVPRLEALWTAELRQRFLREAELTGALDHPHIVPVYEAGEAGPVCYIASMYCPGPNLSEWLAQHPDVLTPRQAALLVATLAEALHYCHQRGILHRDLKPGNVLLVPVADAAAPSVIAELPFVPRLTDFGLAKLMEASLRETRSSVVLGTPLYMAPEQAEGRLAEVGPATDVYALGTILYEALAGRLPFDGPTIFAVLDQIRNQEPARPGVGRSGVPRDLETICLKCLHKEPSRRYASAQALADDLRRFLRGESIQARRRSIWDRLRAWSRRPARIDEAAVLSYLTVFLHTATPCVLALSFLAGFLEVPDVGAAVSGTLVALAGTLPYLVGQLFLTWHAIARRGWAIWAGAILSVGLFLLGIASTAGEGIAPIIFHDMSRTAQLLMVMASATIQGFQLLWWLLALRAYYANRPPRPSP